MTTRHPRVASPPQLSAHCYWAGCCVAFAAPFMILATGCQPPAERIRPDHTAPPGFFRNEVIGKSVQNRPIDCWTLGSGPDVTLIIATIHGDEPAGTPLVRRLASHLAQHPTLLAGRTLLIVPMANPDGHVAHRRVNARGIDLNRNYPASNYDSHGDHGHAPLSEPESRALHQLVESRRPARVLSFHQPIRSGSACIDFDGPAADLAAAMAAACDLPVKKLGGRPGSLGSYVGETLGRPIITVELPAESSHWDESTLWSRYGDMLLAAIRFSTAARSD